jgi:hypothetical protein
MPLPEPVARRDLHTRAVQYRGFLRDDGLWDIEAEITDTKPYDFVRSDGRAMPAGTPVHGMAIRLTVDTGMVIRAVATSMDHTPFGECQQGNDPMQRMVGERLGPGWRQTIEKHLGGVRGCTHLRELLFNMATAAFQAMFGWREREQRLSGAARAVTEPPYHLGGCIAWDTNGPVTARIYPQFVGFQRNPGKKAATPSSS